MLVSDYSLWSPLASRGSGDTKGRSVWRLSIHPHRWRDFNGWNASVTGNANKWLGIAGDFSGSYKSISGVSVNVYSYTFGPVISLNHNGKFNPFVHALFGGAHLGASLAGVGSGGTTGFTMMAGGGADAKLSPHLAVRIFQADWVYYRFQGVGGSDNVRLSTGLVFRF